MQAEKTAIALFFIVIGMFMIDYVSIKTNLGIKSDVASTTFSVISFILMMVFGVAIVYVLQSV